jgi:hypothetical protein
MNSSATVEVAGPSSHENRLHFTGKTWITLLVVLLISAAYAGFYLKRGWIPHDDGAFALSAQRVMRGELPHRDFQEIYTGGLAFLNAGAMRIFGDRLVVMRYPLFAFFVLWTLSLFLITRRFASDLVSAAATLVAVAMSVPNYSAAVPSWYNLFFATFAIHFALRLIETNSSKFLFFAGLCGGLSCLAKISGLYLIAAVLLFLVFHEQEQNQAEVRIPGHRIFHYCVVLGLVVFVFGLFRMLGSSHDASHLYHFVLPGAAVCGLLIWREFSFEFAADAVRWRKMVPLAGIFAAGIAIPIGLFLIPYVLSGSLTSLMHGLFVVPFKRLVFAAVFPSQAQYIPATLLLCILLVAGIYRGRDLPRPAKYVIAFAFAAAFYRSCFSDQAYRLVWKTLALAIPVTVLYAVLDTYVRQKSASRQREPLFLILCVLAVCGLIQFPFGAPIYFLYIAPLLPLAWIAIASFHHGWSRFVFGLTAITIASFFVFLVTPSFVMEMGRTVIPEVNKLEMKIPIAKGLRVDSVQVANFETIMDIVQQNGAGEYIYCTPDCPELYVLAEKRNPVYGVFDFLADPPDTPKVLATLDQDQVNLVAIKLRPAFSPLPKALVAELRARYPKKSIVGNYELRWKP